MALAEQAVVMHARARLWKQPFSTGEIPIIIMKRESDLVRKYTFHP